MGTRPVCLRQSTCDNLDTLDHVVVIKREDISPIRILSGDFRTTIVTSREFRAEQHDAAEFTLSLRQLRKGCDWCYHLERNDVATMLLDESLHRFDRVIPVGHIVVFDVDVRAEGLSKSIQSSVVDRMAGDSNDLSHCTSTKVEEIPLLIHHPV